MRARLLVATLAAVVTLLTASGALSAFQLRSTAEPPPQLIGSWRLNVAKSKYSPGPPLRSETRVYTKQADGVRGVVSRVYSDGRKEQFEYMANFGKDMMVTGIPEYDSVTLRKIDDLTSDAVLSTSTRSRDGRSVARSRTNPLIRTWDGLRPSPRSSRKLA